MKWSWSNEELIEHFILLPDEMKLLGNKTGPTRLGFAILFKYFQYTYRFPNRVTDVPNEVIIYIANQMNINASEFLKYNFSGRTVRYQRVQIREYWNFRLPTNDDSSGAQQWLYQHIDFCRTNLEYVKLSTEKWFISKGIELPSFERIERIANSAINSYEENFYNELFSLIPSTMLLKIDQLISAPDSQSDQSLSFRELRSSTGNISLDTIFNEVRKLKLLQSLEFPENHLKSFPVKFINKYKQRIATEDIVEIRRHPNPIKYSLMVCYLFYRKREITDNLLELLIQVTHKLKVRAERRIEKEMIKDFKKVSGKYGMLYQVAEKALESPDDTIREAIYPIVSEKTLQALVKEHKSTGLSYQKKVYTVMRSSYSKHYRRMLPNFLDVLEFRSNNALYQPIIEAISLIRKYMSSNIYHYPLHEMIPIEGVIRNKWRKITIEYDETNTPRVNRINYEILVLQTLRDKLRCKEIWVVGADRYRNPDEDLPHDYEEKKIENYEALKKPLDAEFFIDEIKSQMIQSLEKLNRTIPRNSKVRITNQKNGWISISPFEAQPDPENIENLKDEVSKQWPMTNLLDVLKETDLMLSFTDHFKTMGVREHLSRETIRKRLILALFGLGTNTGLKRVASGNHNENYRDLLYIRRKFINKDYMRKAISEVVNAIFEIRMTDIWGEGTTSCASDSKKFASYDQNLLTEWHIRYRGRGVMIYWHVEKKSTCIYSQLKSCSSSEVAAMIEGLLRHCTDAEVTENYVDTHGQSEVAFAFCHLLGFKLMPRIKGIGRQRLYRPDVNMKDEYSNLQPVLTRPINWELIRQQYDQMIKYATALRLGTADTEAILKRFTRNNLRHPTYLAFAELGKAIKTIFLCNYLMSEQMRIEINKGLNVIENWNSANSFIFYGRSGEISTNRVDDQEISVLTLHLLQNCMVYINTLMIQQIIKEQNWKQRLTKNDLRALTPLFYNHINPYGSFNLDMDERIEIKT